MFAPVVPADRMHPQYRSLLQSKFHGAARTLMNEIFERMGDPNGNFVRDFQSDGFHSRAFELACFAYLENAGFTIDRSHEQPDFLISREGIEIAVESVTANPPFSQAADISLLQMPQLSDVAITAKVATEFPKRMTKILTRKLAHAYHEFPQCKGKSLVLMIAPFFEPGAVFYTDDALMYALMGAPGPEVEVVSPFFHRSAAETVSAVVYCNQFTVPRFLRLGTDFSASDAPHLTRHGHCYIADQDGEFRPREYDYVVGSEGVPKETWSEGVTIFENPNAAVPLPRDALPASSHVSVRDGYVYREVRGFHPLLSFMVGQAGS